MKAMRWFTCLVMLLVPATIVEAADFTVEVTDQKPPADALSEEILDELADSALSVKAGSRTHCEIWLCKEWPIQADFIASPELLYPFEVGQLLGVVQYQRKGSDFRDQEISKGIYTIRFAHQPQDGNHIGTSDTRDFLLLLKAEDDTKSAILDDEEMVNLSMDAADTAHPAMLSLLLSSVEENAQGPTTRHDEERDFWSVIVSNKANAGGKPSNLVVEFVIDGHTDL